MVKTRPSGMVRRSRGSNHVGISPGSSCRDSTRVPSLKSASAKVKPEISFSDDPATTISTSSSELTATVGMAGLPFTLTFVKCTPLSGPENAFGSIFCAPDDIPA